MWLLQVVIVTVVVVGTYTVDSVTLWVFEFSPVMVIPVSWVVEVVGGSMVEVVEHNTLSVIVTVVGSVTVILVGRQWLSEQVVMVRVVASGQYVV